jgi:hypothetical protein
VILAVAGCGGHSGGWRSPVAAGVFAATAAANVITAATGGGKPDAPKICKPLEKPNLPGCFAPAQAHDSDASCSYFCTDHCSYHIVVDGLGPKPKASPYDMAPGCLPPPLGTVDGCVEKELMRSHDDKTGCLYFCVEHCVYHDGLRGKLRR